MKSVNINSAISFVQSNEPVATAEGCSQGQYYYFTRSKWFDSRIAVLYE